MDGSKTEILIFVRNKEDGKSEVESVRTECEISVNGKIEKNNKLKVNKVYLGNMFSRNGR